jgi:holo-[acyl-carrier protein] synthase
MKTGIGTDVEKVERFMNLDLVKDHTFLTHIFSMNELEYCFSKNDPAPHLAARFSAKEAILKALYSLDIKSVNIKDIEILNNEMGMPIAHLINKKGTNCEISLSLSHCDEIAIAFALITRQNENSTTGKDQSSLC